MHCSVSSPVRPQSGMRTWPFRSPSKSHIHGLVECVHMGILEIPGGRGGGRGEGGRREKGGKEVGGEERKKERESGEGER